jgi:hypothetical protein
MVKRFIRDLGIKTSITPTFEQITFYMKHSNALHKNILLLTGLQPYETTQIAFNPYNYNLRDYTQLKLLLFVFF